MNSPAKKVLIIGGGFSGMSAAIELRKHGSDVDLVEIDPGWRSYGAGISLGGATLRAFEQLGILDTFMREGSGADGLELRAPNDSPIGIVPTPRVAGPDIPGNGGIMRPTLARMLADVTRASGTNVRLGCTFSEIEQNDNQVSVTFTDGARRNYDLVIGADGLYSKTREALFPDAPKPRYVGQSVWRAMFPRPPEVTTLIMWLGGKVKPAVNPVSAAEMYMFITENRAVNDRIDPKEFPRRMADLLAEFRSPMLQQLRADLSANPTIVFRPLEKLLVPQPWHRGKVVLIGDAVHATTPHLASGACIGIEDAIVLAEEIGRDQPIDKALQNFGDRRWERCRMVVENSARLAEIEIAAGDMKEHAQIMRDSLQALAAPI